MEREIQKLYEPIQKGLVVPKKMKKRLWIPKRGYCCDDEDE